MSKGPATPKTTDLEALARRYLDLWQEQVAAMATDPKVAEAVATGVALMNQGAATFAQAVNLKTAAKPGGKPDERDPAGSPSVAAAPDDPRLDGDQLARRLAAVEERLAALEAALGAAGGKPEAKSRRRRA
jgi:hypothetical protein